MAQGPARLPRLYGALKQLCSGDAAPRASQDPSAGSPTISSVSAGRTQSRLRRLFSEQGTSDRAFWSAGTKLNEECPHPQTSTPQTS